MVCIKIVFMINTVKLAKQQCLDLFTALHALVFVCVAAYQCSRRGGELELELRGDRVDITGRAVVLLQGILKV